MKTKNKSLFLQNLVAHSILIVGCLVGIANRAEAADPVCERPFVFFDLGNTLIDTSTHKSNPMFLMPGAVAYLTELSAKNYPIGLVSDVPEIWGRDQADVIEIQDYPTAKWKRLLNFARGVYPTDKSSWMGPDFQPNWFGAFLNSGAQLFFNGLVFLPLTDSERKRNGSIVTLQRALASAQAKGCPALYLGEDAAEMALAKTAGLIPFHVGHTLPTSFYLPEDQIAEYVRTHAARR